jgi:hypothetical protein
MKDEAAGHEIMKQRLLLDSIQDEQAEEDSEEWNKNISNL